MINKNLDMILTTTSARIQMWLKLETVHSGQTKWYNLNSCERLKKKLSNFRSFWMHSDILHFKSPFLLRVSVSYFYKWICCTISFRCVSTCTVICKNKNANFYHFFLKQSNYWREERHGARQWFYSSSIQTAR